MPIKQRLLLLSLLLAPCLAHAAFYLEPRVSWLKFSGTPNIGDRGWVARSDEPEVVPTLAVGYELSPRLRLELRYTPLGDFTSYRFAPSAAIFPGDEVSLPYVRPYEYRQRTDLYTVALPIRMLDHKRLAVSVTPLLIADDSDVEVADYVYYNLPVILDRADAGAFIWPGPTVPATNRRVLRHSDKVNLRLGGELALRYSCTDKLALTAHCNWSNLRTADLLAFGGGVEFRF